MNKQEP